MRAEGGEGIKGINYLCHKNAVVRFYDLQGKLVAAHLFSFSTDVDTESWPTGIYVWEICHGNQKAASGKWMKE